MTSLRRISAILTAHKPRVSRLRFCRSEELCKGVEWMCEDIEESGRGYGSGGCVEVRR